MLKTSSKIREGQSPWFSIIHGRTILKLSTLKSLSCLNIKRLREEHNKALNAAKDKGATEFIEELDKLRQILEEEKYDAI